MTQCPRRQSSSSRVINIFVQPSGIYHGVATLKKTDVSEMRTDSTIRNDKFYIRSHDITLIVTAVYASPKRLSTSMRLYGRVPHKAVGLIIILSATRNSTHFPGPLCHVRVHIKS
jgi:hypothetical protein